MNTAYDNFQIYYPSIASDVIDFYEKGYYEVIARLSDGRLISYYDLDKTIRVMVGDCDELNEEQFRREFARRLRRLMYVKGVTQMALAERTRISDVILSRYMTGKTMPGFYNLNKIASALNCSLDDFRYDFEGRV